MQSQFTRGANRIPLLVSLHAPRSLFCSSRFRSGSFAITSVVLLLALAVCAPARAQQSPDNAQQPDQTQPSESSSSSTNAPASSQQTAVSRRSFESRRQLTKQRREAAAVTETYTHRWDIYGGGGYMRFRPGPDIHNSGMRFWTFGVTRYFTPRFGITVDARGLYGNNSLGAVQCGGYPVACNARFSVFPFTIGPQYRFYGTSKWSISGAVQGGSIYGYFDADTGGPPPQTVGLYPAGNVPGGIVSLNIDYNLSPSLAVRIAPNVLFDNFGGNVDHNQGFLVGVVYRLGRQ